MDLIRVGGSRSGRPAATWNRQATHWNIEPSWGTGRKLLGHQDLVGETVLSLETAPGNLGKARLPCVEAHMAVGKNPLLTLVPSTLIVSNKESIREPCCDIIRTW